MVLTQQQGGNITQTLACHHLNSIVPKNGQNADVGNCLQCDTSAVMILGRTHFGVLVTIRSLPIRRTVAV